MDPVIQLWHYNGGGNEIDNDDSFTVAVGDDNYSLREPYPEAVLTHQRMLSMCRNFWFDLAASFWRQGMPARHVDVQTPTGKPLIHLGLGVRS